MISPCIQHCVLKGGKCQGCFRTSSEITRWTRMSDEERLLVMQRIEKEKQGAYR
jgi:predicted Fe-S protein YdhL (DUF1289 family)